MPRCAYITHLMAKTSEGGAEEQMFRTMEAIARSRPDHKIDLFDPWSDSLDDFDIVHLFAPTNFPLECSRIAQYSKEHGIKVVTTPIFYPDMDMEGSLYTKITSKMLVGFKGLFTMRPFDSLNPYIWTSKVLESSDLVLPNSMDESRMISRYFRKDPRSFRIVPNGVDPGFEVGDPLTFNDAYGLNDFVLFVGRIQPIKNVVGLIEAFVRSDLDTDLVIIGTPTDPAYLQKCRSLSTDRVHYIPSVPHGSELLSSAYKAAKVVALPSFHETVGLVGLEGGLAGANVVVTKNGGAREYLEDHAWYVDPYDVSNITRALVDAYRSERRPDLAAHIKEKFSWEESAKLTVGAYDDVMGPGI